MVYAAATGRLDFAKADDDNSVWILREYMVLQQVERELIARLAELRAARHAALTVASATAGNQEMLRTHLEGMSDAGRSVGSLLVPYGKWSPQDYYRSELERMRAEYVAKFGDPSTPEAKAQAKRDRAAVQRRSVEVQQVEEQRRQAQHDLAARLRALRRRRGDRIS